LEGELNGLLLGSVPRLTAFSIEPVAEFPIGSPESVMVSCVVVRAREGYVFPIMTDVVGSRDTEEGGGRHEKSVRRECVCVERLNERKKKGKNSILKGGEKR